MNESVHNSTAMAETELKPKNKGQFRPGEGGRPKGVQQRRATPYVFLQRDRVAR